MDEDPNPYQPPVAKIEFERAGKEVGGPLIKRLPISSAYLIAPAFILVCAGREIIESEMPLIGAGASIAAGLVCAATLHAYVAVKAVITGRR